MFFWGGLLDPDPLFDCMDSSPGPSINNTGADNYLMVQYRQSPMDLYVLNSGPGPWDPYVFLGGLLDPDP
jgi:hypothetical protein